MSPRAVALVLVLLVAPTGCGASTSSTTSPGTTTATQTAGNLAQACDYWRTSAAPVVSAYHTMRAARTKQDTGVASWTTVRDATGAYGAASRKFAGQLIRPPQPWPPPLDKAAAPLATFYLLTAAWAEQVSRAATESDFTTLWANDPSAKTLPSDLTAAQSVASKACPGSG